MRTTTLTLRPIQVAVLVAVAVATAVGVVFAITTFVAPEPIIVAPGVFGSYVS